jgi:hypothetical protein
LAAKEVDQLADGAADQIRTARLSGVVVTIFRQRVGDEHARGMAISEVGPAFQSDIVG